MLRAVLEQAGDRRARVGGEVEQRVGEDAEEDRGGGADDPDEHDLGIRHGLGGRDRVELRRAARDRGDAGKIEG